MYAIAVVLLYTLVGVVIVINNKVRYYDRCRTAAAVTRDRVISERSDIQRNRGHDTMSTWVTRTHAIAVLLLVPFPLYFRGLNKPS